MRTKDAWQDVTLARATSFKPVSDRSTRRYISKFRHIAVGVGETWLLMGWRQQWDLATGVAGSYCTVCCVCNVGGRRPPTRSIIGNWPTCTRTRTLVNLPQSKFPACLPNPFGRFHGFSVVATLEKPPITQNCSRTQIIPSTMVDTLLWFGF